MTNSLPAVNEFYVRVLLTFCQYKASFCLVAQVDIVPLDEQNGDDHV